ncbi:hypothetical protein V501_01808 [Pseudogymnoascus sp. VKM F-4519 (FW-2642)]|nr:hypothetical protein V501_01808 [Pseudogymnoascus sp. VKM F-4519 (FW-2642)]
MGDHAPYVPQIGDIRSEEQTSPANGSTISASSSLFVEEILRNELVDLYFKLIHDKQHSLFHPLTFIASVYEGRAPIFLVFAMMSLAARFSENPYFHGTDPWSRGRAWAEESIRLFDRRMTPISIEALQACSLLLHISFIEGDMETESLYGALAIRMAQRLELPKVLSMDRVEREVQIRCESLLFLRSRGLMVWLIWWTTWSMDNWSSAGARHPKQLHLEPSYPKPMDDLSFELLKPGPVDFEKERRIEDVILERESSLWAQMIPLTDMISQIEELHELTVRDPSNDIDIYKKATLLAHRLDSWLLRLPEGLKNTPENFKRYHQLGHGRTFVWLHLHYHHHSQLLYYQFLHYDPKSTPDPIMRHTYANRCKEHAKHLSSLLWTANSTLNCECVWVVTGHLLVISSSVHLHTLLFATNDQQIEEAKQFLKQNFEMLIRLRKYWPLLDLSLSRLQVFHEACRKNMNTSFRMDNWMLQFLQRYTRPCAWKDSEPVEETPADWSPSSHETQGYIHHLTAGSEILNRFLV